MSRFWIAVIAGLLIDNTLFAAEPRAWTTFECPEGRFSIKLPASPTKLNKETELEQGVTFGCVSPELDCQFRAGYGDPPKLEEGQTNEKHFEGIAADNSEGTPKLAYYRVFAHQDKYSAMELTTLPYQQTDGKEVMTKCFFVVTPRHTILIRITGPKIALEGKHVAESLDSLTIKE